MVSVLTLCVCLTTAESSDRPCVITVVGAPGASEYGAQFAKWANLWDAAAKKAGAESIRIGMKEEPGGTDRERLRKVLAEQASAASREPVWLVLIGHGTFDGREAKYNLRGPDVSDAELALWIAPIKRTVAVLDCTASSSPFLNRLSGPNRVIVTATRSGSEQNYARIGQYLSESIADPSADLDKDGQISLLEAFLTASGRVNEYYKTRAQLATEHALLDDNGDKLGTPADWFHGVRATRRAKDGAALDGVRANQLVLIPSDRERTIPADVRRKRDELELAIAALREKKEKVKEDEYYAKLEPLMLELARLYRDLPASGAHGR